MQRNHAQPPLELPSPTRLLGGLAPAAFFRDYWHKRPLLVRQAVPGLDRILGRDGLLELATRDDAESRLVRQTRQGWQLDFGPFEADALARLPKRNWSVLVQGVNLLLLAGDALLNCFNFAPYARLDDLMVSYAPPGGGVGPHFDSYDVFLIQGLGRRRWEISAQTDLELVPGAPLRILKRFHPEQSWELEPGDLLYLPPKYAHNGIALSDCMTWSIGFRAPSAQEIATQFLVYLQDTLELEGRYADPDLRPSRHPGRIPGAMARQLKAMIRQIRWNDSDMATFIGRYLSEPKPSVFFEPPARPLPYPRFCLRVQAAGVRLDPRSRLLYDGDQLYINGEGLAVGDDLVPCLRILADKRRLPGHEIHPAALPMLYQWYRAGFLHFTPP
jgi:50S ribosomal protein L16 3-hydroxylase